jgi:hypothetical protein
MSDNIRLSTFKIAWVLSVDWVVELLPLYVDQPQRIQESGFTPKWNYILSAYQKT